MDIKRISLIVGFIALCIGLGFLIYRVFFATRVTPPDAPGVPITTPGTFPSVGEGQVPIGTDPSTLPPVIGTLPTTPIDTTFPPTISPIADRPGSIPLVSTVVDARVLGASLGPGSNARFYNQDDGRFYVVDPSGNIRALSDTIFYSVDNVTWSPRTNEAIIEYPDGSNIHFNFDTNRQTTLPRHWESFSFSTEGSQIVAKSIGLAPENRWLIASDPQGNNIRLIEPLGDNASKVIVDWSPTRQVVALSLTGEPLGGNRQEVLLIGQNRENFKSITVEGRGLQSQWSPQGTKLLHSVYSGRTEYQPELWIVDATPDTAGNNRKPLGLNTWASKCTMTDERTVYCGVPETLDVGAGFAPEIANFTPDILYRVDVVTGVRTEIPTNVRYTIDSMFVSQDGSTLYFTDKNNPGIFEIPIK